MTTTTLTPTLRLTVVKHLAGGKDPDMVATITGLPRETVVDIGSHHGYPDKGKLSWAADILAKKINDEAKDFTPPTYIPPSTPRVVAPTVTSSSPNVQVKSPEPQAAASDGIAAMLDKAAEHPSKLVQNAAAKVRSDLERLTQRIKDYEAKHAEQIKAQRAKAAARAEVERLEQELRDAKAKLRGGKAVAAAAPSTGGIPKGTKRPTGEYPCRNEGCDQVISTPQGRGLHERQHCDHRAEQAAS